MIIKGLIGVSGCCTTPLAAIKICTHSRLDTIVISPSDICPSIIIKVLARRTSNELELNGNISIGSIHPSKTESSGNMLHPEIL
jgi:hypothetical protein